MRASASARKQQEAEATVARASEWSGLGDVVLRGTASNVSASAMEPPPSPAGLARGSSVQQREDEVVRMMRKSRSYDDLPSELTTERGIREIFDRMDRDGNGKLSRAELKEALIEHDITTPPEERGRAEDEVERVLHTTDADLDGTISFEEFHQLLREQHVRRAALYIEDGLSARSVHRLGARNLWMHRLFTSSRWQSFVLCACLVHMSVAFFEHPAWVQPADVPRVGKLNTIVLDHPGFRYVLLGVELACITVYFFDTWLYNGFRPQHGRDASGAVTSAWKIEGQRQRDLWVLTRFAIAVAMALDVALAATGLRLLRFTRPLRPVVLATRKRGAKEVLKNIAATVPQQGKVLFGIFSVIGLWAFVGFLLFKDVDPASFGTVPRSIQSMLLIFLSASYNQHIAEHKLADGKYRAVTAVFFVSYLAVCNMFLLRLVTAVAFDSFQQFARAERISVLSARKSALDRAFDLVASPVADGSDLRMSRDSFVAIMQLADRHAGGESGSQSSCLCFKSTTHDLQPAEKAQLLFGIADTDNDETITLQEFYSVCYLWRYARITQVNQTGQHCVRIGKRWVPSGTTVYFRDPQARGRQQEEEEEKEGGQTWRRGTVEDNTEDGDQVRVRPLPASQLVRGPLASPGETPDSLYERLVTSSSANSIGHGSRTSSSSRAAAESREIDLWHADIRIAFRAHPLLACEEMLEHRVRLWPLTRRIRTFDLIMSICVLLNMVQLGVTASLPERSGGSLAATLVLLLAFCFETLIKISTWGWVKYSDHGAVIDVVTVSAGLFQYGLLLLRRDFDADLNANLQEVLLILQALRVVKLLRILSPAMHIAMNRVARHTLDHAYVFTLLLYVSAIFGQELFAGKLSGDLVNDDPRYANWASIRHVFSFDDFGSALLALFQVSLVANWWVVMVSASVAIGSAAKAHAFFFIFKIVIWVLYLPIFVGFIITAFSKINAQMVDDFANDASSGMVAELPAAGPGEHSQQAAEDVVSRKFIVKVLTQVTNKLYGIDPVMTRMRRQLQEQASHMEELVMELDSQEQKMARMQAVLDQHGLTIDSLDEIGLDSSLELPHRAAAQDHQQQQEEEVKAEAEAQDRQIQQPTDAVSVPVPFSVPTTTRRRVYATSSSPEASRTASSSSVGVEHGSSATGASGPRGGSGGGNWSNLRRSVSIRRSTSSFSATTPRGAAAVERLLSRSFREPTVGRPLIDIGDELASLDDRASPRTWRERSLASQMTQIQ